MKARYWWQKERSTSKERKKKTVHYERQPPAHKETSFKDWFRRTAVGRCYRCLASDHKVAQCRDPPKCVACFRPGHKARFSRSGFKLPQHTSVRVDPTPQRVPFAKAKNIPLTNAPLRNFDPAGGEKKEAMEDHMTGAPHKRPSKVVVCSRRSEDMDAEERDLNLRAMLAVAVDSQALLSCRQVEESARRQLQLGQSRLEVSVFAKAEFMLWFADPAMKRRALASKEPLFVGRTKLNIIPWSRHTGAEAVNLCYRGRVCLEGVPRHAWQVEAVKPLFDRAAYIEGVDVQRKKEEGSACLVLNVWMAEPDAIA